MDKDERKLQKLLQTIEIIDGDYVTVEEIAPIIAELVSIVSSIREENDSKLSDFVIQLSNRLEELSISIKENSLKSEQLVNQTKQETLVEVKSLTRQLNDEITRVTKLIPKIPDLSYLERLIREVERKIPKIPYIPEPETPESIKDKLETLEGDERLSWKAIKGLEDVVRSITGNISQRFVAAGVRLFTLLNDTPNSYTGYSGYVVAVNSSESGLEFVPAGGTGSAVSLSVTPSGDVDGVNTVFTIPAQVSSLAVYSDGARAFPTDDYSVVVGVGITTITFESGRQPSDESKGGSILVDYTV